MQQHPGDEVLDAFRRWGYLQADLDPLHFLKPVALGELDVQDGAAREARGYYCGSIGVEFMHIADQERRTWIQERMERTAEQPDRQHILDLLVRTEVFEQTLQKRFPGTKRFSIEGGAALIPLLDDILDLGCVRGATEAVIGMSHRGRLNVMVHVVDKPAEEVFTGFEDIDPHSVLGGGDVHFHRGATGVHTTSTNHTIQVRMVSNPSHLEAVDPVALGRVRAKQRRLGSDGTTRVLPILIHGDAGFAGQGILAETLNLAGLDGYSVGGAIHVIVDNRIGFTTNPSELHGSRFASDIARRLNIPILHVNGEDPDAVVRAGRMALEYRYAFGSAAVVDLICFRRHGHSEIDDPTITQPLLYRAIRNHPPLWELYAASLSMDARPAVDAVRAEYGAAQERASAATATPSLSSLPEYWEPYRGGSQANADHPDTGIGSQDLREVARALVTVPPRFILHPKVRALLEKRRQAIEETLTVDFAMAELLGFGTLLRQGVSVRLSGEDSGRGTFGQRHAILIDGETEEQYIPLCHVAEKQASFEIYNSPLSEAAVLGFEYGYSRDAPESLVLWEAQFGDFANGAQVIIDQFICAAEDKWGLPSGIVLLLPHGFEGQGPEHSSARIERFLQLFGEDNIQVCQPGNAAQYFHLLRGQALRQWRKPLVLFTPKSMLRRPEASSPLDDLTSGRFSPVLTEDKPLGMTRVLVCSGKIYHELRNARRKCDASSVAIVSLEQLAPFPGEELRMVLDSFTAAEQIIWVQEEPANMGALAFVFPKLQELAGGRWVRSVKRTASASPATGSAKAHEIEQKTLIQLALRQEDGTTTLAR